MSDDDFIWLLQTLKNSSKDFETIYGIGFYLNDVIIMKDRSPSQWFYMNEKKQIKIRSEEWNKPRVLKEYFMNPKLTLNQVKDFGDGFVENNFTQEQENQHISMPPKNDKCLFYFYQTIRKQKVIRPATQSVVEKMFSRQEYQEVMKTWEKVIGFSPINDTKDPGLYEVNYQKDFNTNKEKTQITRKIIFTQKKLMEAEFVKTENQKLNLKFEENEPYKSLATNVNEKCMHFVLSILKHIERKFQERVANMKIEFFLTENGKIYLTGCDQFQFYDSSGDTNLDKYSLQPVQAEKQIPYKCPGIYCDCAGENFFYDENDEAFSLFIAKPPAPQEKQHREKRLIRESDKNIESRPNFQQKQLFVQRKSIFIDIIERQKTIELIKSVQPTKITEQLIFKCRQYYSISQLLADNKFKHLKVDNFYERVRVCDYCYNMYNKLDNIRIEQLNKKVVKKITQDYINQQIEKLTNQQGILPGQKMRDKEGKSKMSWKFYQKLKEFDITAEKFNQDYDLTHTQDPGYFNKRFKPFHESVNNFFSLTTHHSAKSGGKTKSFQLPQIQVKILTDKQKMLKKKQILVNSQETEALGLKHYLGHTKNLPFSDCGLAISKSSLTLNHLQDKIQEVQLLKEKIQNQKIQQVRQEIELMFCPYFGNGKRDTTRFADFIEQLKEREQDGEQQEFDQESKVQVVTDKNEFLTENQRKQKQDKEQKEQQIQETKKNFLEMNSQLAESIIEYKQAKRKLEDQKKKPSVETNYGGMKYGMNKKSFGNMQTTLGRSDNIDESSDDQSDD